MAQTSWPAQPGAPPSGSSHQGAASPQPSGASQSVFSRGAQDLHGPLGTIRPRGSFSRTTAADVWNPHNKGAQKTEIESFACIATPLTEGINHCNPCNGLNIQQCGSSVITHRCLVQLFMQHQAALFHAEGGYVASLQSTRFLCTTG